MSDSNANRCGFEDSLPCHNVEVIEVHDNLMNVDRYLCRLHRDMVGGSGYPMRLSPVGPKSLYGAPPFVTWSKEQTNKTTKIDKDPFHLFLLEEKKKEEEMTENTKWQVAYRNSYSGKVYLILLGDESIGGTSYTQGESLDHYFDLKKDAKTCAERFQDNHPDLTVFTKEVQLDVSKLNILEHARPKKKVEGKNMAIFRYKYNEKKCQKHKKGHKWCIYSHLVEDTALAGNPQVTIEVDCVCCRVVDEIIVSSKHDVYKEAQNFLNEHNVIDPSRHLLSGRSSINLPTEHSVYVSSTKKFLKKIVSIALLPLKPLKVLKVLDPGWWTPRDPSLGRLMVGMILGIGGITVGIPYLCYRYNCATPNRYGTITSMDIVGNSTFVSLGTEKFRCTLHDDFGRPKVGDEVWICIAGYLHVRETGKVLTIKINEAERDESNDKELKLKVRLQAQREFLKALGSLKDTEDF